MGLFFLTHNRSGDSLGGGVVIDKERGLRESELIILIAVALV